MASESFAERTFANSHALSKVTAACGMGNCSEHNTEWIVLTN